MLVATSPAGERLASLSEDGTLSLWDFRTAARLAGSIDLPGALGFPKFSPSGRFIAVPWGGQMWKGDYAAAEVAEAVRVLDGQSGQTVVPSIGSQGEQLWGFLGDERLVTTNRRKVRIWTIPAGTLQAELPAEESDMGYVAPSGDGLRLATITRAGKLRICDARDGHLLRGPFDSLANPTHVEFSRLGDLLALSNSAGVAEVRQATSGALLFTVSHRGTIFRASFSPDGRWLLTVSMDETARLWDTRTGEPVTHPMRHHYPLLISDGSFSPDGKSFATCGWGANIWKLTQTELSIDALRSLSEVQSGFRFAESPWGLAALGRSLVADQWQSRPPSVREPEGARRDRLLNWVTHLDALGARLSQTFDARPYRGRTIRARGWIRIEPDPSGWALRRREHDRRKRECGRGSQHRDTERECRGSWLAAVRGRMARSG